MLDVAHQRHKKMYESRSISSVTYATHDVFGCVDGAASRASSDERSDPATGVFCQGPTGISVVSLLKG